MHVKLLERPSRNNCLVVQQIIDIVTELTEDWFTKDVPEWIENDLLFQDVICLEYGDQIRSFIIFTSIEGVLNITLMGTKPVYRNQGYGSKMMEMLFEYANDRGFRKIELLTVPPEKKSSYHSTVAFYSKHGFVRGKEYPELWDTGAVKFTKIFE